jgi:type IV pilus assembly protein PilW
MSRLRYQRGMSIIEIMVAVAIGLIGCVVIFQMFTISEARKRTIASGSDMDISGRLGLMTLERDVQLAGYGYGAAASPSAISTGAALGCTVTAYDSARGGTQDFTYVLAPVQITDGAAGAPDTIAVLRGSSSMVANGKPIDQSSATAKRIKADTGGRTGVRPGDVVIAVSAGGGLTCGMYEITGNANTDQVTLDNVDSASYTDAAGVVRTARYNKSGGIAFALSGEGRLYTLGPSPARNLWTVAGNKLVVANDLAWADGNGDGANDQLEAADAVLDLQAQYGVDADNNGMLSDAEWTSTDPADWTQLLAVRFALLTRGQQFERDKVTNTAPRWSAGAFTMKNVDGTADSDPTGAGAVNNWRNYRYGVFEAVVPLRNTIIGRQL